MIKRYASYVFPAILIIATIEIKARFLKAM